MVADSSQSTTRRLLASSSNFFVPSDTSTSTTTNNNKDNVRFTLPLLDAGYLPAVLEAEQKLTCHKPLLLYLPGFDGTLLSPFLQFPELGTVFEVQGMTVDMEDRSTLDELRDKVIQQLLLYSNNSTKRRRPIYLVGESFGGILALEVALYIQDHQLPIDIKGLSLVNPATCYATSQLAQHGPTVATITSPANYLISFLRRLLPLFLDDYQLPQLLLILSAQSLPSVIDTPQREAYMGRVALSLPSTLKFMPQPTLQWRLHQWLQRGCQRINQRLQTLSTPWVIPTLIVVGEVDKTLPSLVEAQRLSSIFNNNNNNTNNNNDHSGNSNDNNNNANRNNTICQVFVVNGAGHASTCGSRIDLAAVLRNRFPELLQQQQLSNSSSTANCRTRMKDTAQNGVGKFYGMEPRYDGKPIGLSPLSYWSPEYYKKWE